MFCNFDYLLLFDFGFPQLLVKFLIWC